MKNFFTAIKNVRCFSLVMILLIFSHYTFSQQQQISNARSDGSEIITLKSAGNTISTIPASSPETITRTAGNEMQSPAGDVRDLTWLLKFSAPGKVFKDVSFANSQVGYIVTELGGVYKSIDGGDNWTSVMNLGFPYYWYGVEAVSPDTVMIAGFNNAAIFNQGVIRWTFDGGTTWTSDINLTIPVSGVGWLERIHFFNADTGIVFNSFSGGCWYTTTGGKDSSSWIYETINPDFGWIAGNTDAQSSGKVYATGIHFANSSDYGQDWVSENSADSIFDGGIDFLDSNNLFGWTGGGQISNPVSGWVHRTNDGGSSWSPRLNTFPFPIRALKSFDENNGLAVGGNLFAEEGAIYSTTDGGMNWNMDVNTSAEMFSIETKSSSPDSTDVWCVGSTGGSTGFTGVLYKASTSSHATGIYNNSEGNKTNFELYQNYPNPFSRFTTIRFTIPVSGDASVKIFGITGNEEFTLADESVNAGTHDVIFDAEKLGAGIYYYVIKAGNYSQTKKLVVIK